MLFLPRLALGGDEEIRTLDPLLAGQVLSQLSYTPVKRIRFFHRTLKIEQRTFDTRLVFLFRIVSNTVVSSILILQPLGCPSGSPFGCSVSSESDDLSSRTVSIERR